MWFTILVVALGLVILVPAFVVSSGIGTMNSVRPIAKLIIDSIRTEPGWIFKSAALPIGDEESYDPYWHNKSLDLSVAIFEHVVVQGVPNSQSKELLEMNEEEIEEFDEAVLDREERLFKIRSAMV